MKIWPLVTCFLCTVLVLACDSQETMNDIANSHIEVNVPKGKHFDEYLKRDLKACLCAESEDCVIEYELLREGPTQTGVSYPKFYVWARSLKGKTVEREGAVRVAAVEQKGFNVTNFVSREEISRSPSQVASVFPAPLVDRIIQKAHGAEAAAKP